MRGPPLGPHWPLVVLALSWLPVLHGQMLGDALGAAGTVATPLGGEVDATSMAGPGGPGNGAPGNGGPGPGGGRIYGQRPIGGLTEKIEGCFDRFDSEYAVELGRDHINNRRCQAICTERGYALSATGLVDSCFCGNDYPSIFHRVDTGQCDMPCNPDKASCFAFTCCGSRDERFFTVSWSGEMDVMKQLLRQLSHDYRFNNPTFQGKVEENGFCDRVSLRLGPSPVQGGDEREELQGEGQRQATPPPLFLSVGDGCPVGWTLFDCWCYKQHWAEPSTYDEAVVKCREEPGSCGSELVTVTSEAENCFLRKMAGGCQGWLGYKAPPASTELELGYDGDVLGAFPGHGRGLLPSGPLVGSGLREKLANLTQSLRWRDWPAPASHKSEGGTDDHVRHRERLKQAVKPWEGRRRARWFPPRFEHWRGQHGGAAAKGQAHEGERIVRTGIIGLFNSTSLDLGLDRAQHDNDTSRQRRPIVDLAFNYLLRRPHRRETTRLAKIGMEYDDVGIRSLRFVYANPHNEHQHQQRERVGQRPHRQGARAAGPELLAGRGDADDGDGRGKLKAAAVRLGPDERLVGVKAVIGVLGIRSLTWITRSAVDKMETAQGPYGAQLLLDRPNMMVRKLRFNAGEGDEEEDDRGVVGLFGHRDAATGYLRGLGFYERVPSNCAWMAGDGNWSMIDCATPHPSEHAPPATSHYVCKKPGWPVRLGACDDGWAPFGEACYLSERAVNTTWWGARRRCQGLGGHLASVASKAENQFVHALLGSRGGYIGYRRRTTAKPWRWDMYSHMKAGGHDEDGGQEACFEMRGGDGAWQRTGCRTPQPRVVLCEVGAGNSSCLCPQPHNASEEASGGFWYAFGCSCYLRWVPGTRHSNTSASMMSWVEAQAFCGRMGGRLVTIESREENEWAQRLAAQSFTFNQRTMPAYIGLNNLMNGGDDYEWTYYENWRPQPTAKGPALAAATTTAKRGQPISEVDRSVVAMCMQMDANGTWVEVPCDEYGNSPKASCFVCKQPRAATYPALRPHADECWFVDVVNETTRGTGDPVPYPWCADCSEAYLQSDRNGQFLCADAQNWLYLSWARDPAWCLWTLLVHPETGAMVLLTRHNAALYYDAATGVLACRNLPPEVNVHARYGQRDHFHHWWRDHKHGQEPHQQQQQEAPPQPTPSPWDQPPPPGEDEAPWEWEQSIFAQDDIAVLYPSHPVGKLAWRHLRISILARSRDLEQPGLKECSIAIHDDSPRTNSYRCWRRPYSGTDDLVYLEQEALLFFDQSTFATPRVPLPNGRVRCENQSPTETATCTFAYGQGLTLSRQFRANWGYTISDVITHRVNVNPAQQALFRLPGLPQKERKQRQRRQHPKKPPRTKFQQKAQERRQQRQERLRQHLGKKNKTRLQPLQGPDLTLSMSELKEFQNAFSVAYNNFCEILIVKSYVETRNWQLSVPVAPRTTDTIQFWLSAENLRYRWRALFAARGGFTLTVWGQPIGDHHSLGDLSYFRDLFFFVFGTYEFPYEAEIIITVNDIPGDGWPLPLPEQSQGDRIRDVTRNGQLGFGYSPQRGPF